MSIAKECGVSVDEKRSEIHAHVTEIVRKKMKHSFDTSVVKVSQDEKEARPGFYKHKNIVQM